MHLRVLLCLVASLAACAPSREAPASPAIVVVDDNGDTTRLTAPASRIVSLSPSSTELVFALGAGDHLVGRTRWCDYPAAVARVPDVGEGIPPNIEAVLAQHPDLVLLYRSAQNRDAAERFRAAGVAVLTLRMDLLDDVSRLARLLGPALGRQQSGDSLAAAYDAALRGIRDSLARADQRRPSILLLAWDQPPIAIGAGSFQSEILSLAGGRNIVADITAPSAPVSIESIASRNPDFILTSDSAEPAYAGKAEWRVVPAIARRRFIRYGDPAFGRPSPRAPLIIEALRRQILAARN
ncbi:MAG TPA: helical backbone metal receptor [Gemmatimonadales bacterium]|nr:helical backbone metal receptor [Gemmatimonadales bacterium]